MKKTLALFAVVLAVGMTAAVDAEARRLGGGKSFGMQRQAVTPAKPAAPTTTAPATSAQPGAAAAAPGAAAAAPRRSWMGPIAGLAAGLGLAALASHLGFGAAFANILMIGLLLMAALFVVGLVMRKRAGGAALAGAGGHGRGAAQQPAGGMFRSGAPQAGSLIGSRIAGGMGLGAGAAGAGAIPADFDVPTFVRHAKGNFVALQAANDAGDLDRLRSYLSPELFEVARAEMGERGDAPQQTEVFGLEAQVLEVSEDAEGYIVSVRFTGSVREAPGAVPEDLDEVWHLTKPRSGGGWVVAGIQQTV